MGNTFSLDAIIEAVAAAVAAKLSSHGTVVSDAISVQPRLLSIEQAAIYLGRTKTAVQHLIADGTLPIVRGDRRVFLDKKDLDQWIDRNKV